MLYKRAVYGIMMTKQRETLLWAPYLGTAWNIAFLRCMSFIRSITYLFVDFTYSDAFVLATIYRHAYFVVHFRIFRDAKSSHSASASFLAVLFRKKNYSRRECMEENFEELIGKLNSGDVSALKMVTEAMVPIVKYLDKSKRETCRRRQAEGIAAAKEKGVKFGRKPIKLPHIFHEVLKSYMDGEISTKQAADILGVSRPTFLKWREVEISERT